MELKVAIKEAAALITAMQGEIERHNRLAERDIDTMNKYQATIKRLEGENKDLSAACEKWRLDFVEQDNTIATLTAERDAAIKSRDNAIRTGNANYFSLEDRITALINETIRKKNAEIATLTERVKEQRASLTLALDLVCAGSDEDTIASVLRSALKPSGEER